MARSSSTSRSSVRTTPFTCGYQASVTQEDAVGEGAFGWLWHPVWTPSASAAAGAKAASGLVGVSCLQDVSLAAPSKPSLRSRAIKGGARRVFDVFISYARSTTAKQAQQVGEALQSLGYTVWRDDQLSAHGVYTDIIEQRLRTARAVVVVWSAEARQSDWVRAEAEVARQAGTLVQLTIDGSAPPLPFSQIQCADMAGWSGDTGADGWRKVVASVAALTGGAADLAVQAPARPKPSPPVEPLLAVLPFDNVSSDIELSFFSDGVSDEIRETIARGADLRVIGRGSSFQFRGAAKSASRVAAQVKATHILDGSVQRSGLKLRITAELVDCATETTVWTRRFDRDLSDIFALQDEIAAAVATALRVAITMPATPLAIDPPTYDRYLAAREASFRPKDDIGVDRCFRESAGGDARRAGVRPSLGRSGQNGRVAVALSRA